MGWEITPKNEIPKGLKEEVEVAEADKEALRRALAISKWKKAGGKIDKQPENMEKWWGQLTPEDKKRAANIAQYKKEKKQKKEEVEIDEALKPADKKVIDAFYDKEAMFARMLSTDGKSLYKLGMGGQTIAQWLEPSGKIAISAVTDVKSTESILNYMKKSIPKNNFDKKSYSKFFEDVDEKHGKPHPKKKIKFKLKQFKHMK